MGIFLGGVEYDGIYVAGQEIGNVFVGGEEYLSSGFEFEFDMRTDGGSEGVGYNVNLGVLSSERFTYNDVQYEVVMILDRSRLSSDDYVVGFKRVDNTQIPFGTLDTLSIDTGSSGKSYKLSEADDERREQTTVLVFDFNDDVENLYAVNGFYSLRLYE